MLSKFRQLTRRFRDSEEGTMAVEAVLMFPMLIWALLATYVYFDAFRNQSINLKAAYTISDAVSREDKNITPEYMDSLFRLHLFLTSSNYDTKLAVSVVSYDAENEDYNVVWSKARGGAQNLNEARLDLIEDQIPILPDEERIVIVQSWVIYEPSFSVGLDAFSFDNLIVTAPRYTPSICWNPVNDSTSQSSSTC